MVENAKLAPRRKQELGKSEQHTLQSQSSRAAAKPLLGGQSHHTGRSVAAAQKLQSMNEAHHTHEICKTKVKNNSKCMNQEETYDCPMWRTRPFASFGSRYAWQASPRVLKRVESSNSQNGLRAGYRWVSETVL